MEGSTYYDDATFATTVEPSQAFLLFASEDYNDLCEDADLLTFVFYLRGCKGLRIPPEWRPLMPAKL